MTERYSKTAIAFHWTIAALILLNLWLGLAHDSLPRDWQVMPVHKAVGILILALTLVRLGWRLTHRPPEVVPRMPAWERLAANLSHWGLYALTIAIPLTGWMMVSGTEKRRPLTFFSLFDIPYLPVGSAAGDFGHEAHELLAFALIALMVLHILAALRHHLILRDSTLVRMIPALRPPSR